MRRVFFIITIMILLFQPLSLLAKNNINYINSPKLLPTIKSKSDYTIIPISTFLVPVDYNGNPLDYYYDNGLLYVKNNGQPFKLVSKNYTINSGLFSQVFNLSQEKNNNWLQGWGYRTPIIIQEQSGQDLTDYQVKVVLNSSWDGWSYVQSDGRDIRFTLDDGITEIPYWIEEWDYNNKNATIWVKVPSIPKNSQTTIYIYYGNPNVQSESNGDQVFEFFDDFETDKGYWSTVGLNNNAGYEISDGILHVYGTGSNVGGLDYEIYTNYTFTQQFIVETKMKIVSNSYGYVGLFLHKDKPTGDTPYALVFGFMNDGSNFGIGDWGFDNSNTIRYKFTKSLNEWIIWSIRVNYSNLELFINNSYITKVTLSNTINNYIGFGMGYSPNDLYVDWLLIRKYVSIEPKVIIGNTENQWLQGWSYRTPITIIEQSGQDLTNYQVKIVLDSSWNGWNYVQPDGRDIRFTLDDGVTKIPYWIEDWNYNSKNAIIWVKIPFIPKNSQMKIYMYYGNPDVISESNGNEVFEFFDDFNENTIDTSKWYTPDTDYVISDSQISVDYLYVKGFIAEKSKHIVEMKIKASKNVYNYDVGFKFLSDSNTSLGNCYLVGFNLEGSNTVEIGEYKPYNRIAISNFNWKTNTWYYMSTWKDENNKVHLFVEEYNNTNNKIEIISSTTTHRDSGYIGVYDSIPDQKNDVTLDWFRVRKYSPIELKVTIDPNIQSYSTSVNINLHSPFTIILSFTPYNTKSLEILLSDDNDNGYKFDIGTSSFTISTLSNSISHVVNFQNLISGSTYTLIGQFSDNVKGIIFPLNVENELNDNTYVTFSKLNIISNSWDVKKIRILQGTVSINQNDNIGKITIVI